jgi:hypothetical protein
MRGLGWLSLPDSKRALWGRLLAAFPLSERHAGQERVFSNLSLTIDRVFSKLQVFRLSGILFLQIW